MVDNKHFAEFVVMPTYSINCYFALLLGLDA